MSFIALDIGGGCFAKGCGMVEMILHALSADASHLPFSDNAAAELRFHHETAFRMRMCSSALRPALRCFSAVFCINLILDFIT